MMETLSKICLFSNKRWDGKYSNNNFNTSQLFIFPPRQVHLDAMFKNALVMWTSFYLCTASHQSFVVKLFKTCFSSYKWVAISGARFASHLLCKTPLEQNSRLVSQEIIFLHTRVLFERLSMYLILTHHVTSFTRLYLTFYCQGLNVSLPAAINFKHWLPAKCPFNFLFFSCDLNLLHHLARLQAFHIIFMTLWRWHFNKSSWHRNRNENSRKLY